ncbi:class I SAM-dependent methyltransferase [Actinocorallia libanotica]|uniref:class I SAM-dependent methyltransferase n=1 Tax=Actinocorallia libanotica TaxID=46162 RepID=UPI0031D64A10
MRAKDSEADRRRYQADLAQGVERFLQPRRTDCPWCASTRIRVLLHSPEFVQHKPGRFTLERCADCGHVFQNPCLNEAGLEFYYRDFYDGLGAELCDRVMDSAGLCRAYLRRARMLPPGTEPRTWLDVGTGHGHFCRSARQVWPNVRFDGLDQSESVLKAQKLGWIHHAYQGTFPQRAEELAGSYDVVSMHHYLEHTADQHRQLDTAARVLRPGGHLLIEVPDPQCLPARLLGRYWFSWMQPQHLHFAPEANLTRALQDRGFTIVAVHRRRARLGQDFVWAPGLLAGNLHPPVDRPWSPRRPHPGDRLLRLILLALAVPVMPVGLLADWTLGLLSRRSNTYRILAALPDTA